MIVILGTAHLGTTPGKCSPDKKFRECEFSREIVQKIKKELEANGVTTFIDYLPLEPNDQMKAPTYKQEQSKELIWRVNYVNNLCSKYGANNCLYVSVHVNAAGMGTEWMNARGWLVYTSKGNTKSDLLADLLYKKAKELLPFVRSDFSDKDADYESNFYVLAKTKCSAVLTENLFQDNKADVEFLTSEEGKNAIVKVHVDGILDYIKGTK